MSEMKYPKISIRASESWKGARVTWMATYGTREAHVAYRFQTVLGLLPFRWEERVEVSFVGDIPVVPAQVCKVGWADFLETQLVEGEEG